MLTLAVAENPVKVTVALASVVLDPRIPTATLGASKVTALDDLVVIVPTAPVAATPVVIIMVASASTNTETLPKVALAPVKETFASASGVTVPKAEVPT